MPMLMVGLFVSSPLLVVAFENPLYLSGDRAFLFVFWFFSSSFSISVDLLRVDFCSKVLICCFLGQF